MMILPNTSGDIQVEQAAQAFGQNINLPVYTSESVTNSLATKCLPIGN